MVVGKEAEEYAEHEKMQANHYAKLGGTFRNENALGGRRGGRGGGLVSGRGVSSRSPTA